MPETESRDPIDVVYVCGRPMIRVNQRVVVLVNPEKIVTVTTSKMNSDYFTIHLEGGIEVSEPGLPDDLLKLTSINAPGRAAWDPYGYTA